MAVNKEMRFCFSCNRMLTVESRDESAPVDKFETFVIRPPFYYGEQKRYPVLFERVVCKADDIPISGSSIGNTVFVCEPCFVKQAKGFRKKMAEVFLAKLRSRSVSLVHDLFDSEVISVGPSSAARLKELNAESLTEILRALQRERKDKILPELIFALFENGVIIFGIHAKEIFEGLDREHAEFITTSLVMLLSDMRNVLPNPEIENLKQKLSSLEAFLNTPDD